MTDSLEANATLTVDGATRGSTTIFEVRDFAIGFGEGEDVLRNVNMKVAEGEFVVLLGPSGCGKTTLMNVAAGLLTPRHGRAEFDGHPIKGVNRKVGYMTQDDTLLPWMTVRANVGLPLKMRGVAAAEIRERVDRYLSILDLSHAADLWPSQLSGGMRRRALLARSVIYEPKLLLMDEPFAALDAQMRHQMHIEVRSTVKRLNQTVMFVTHDIAEAAKLADRVLIFGGGRPGGINGEFPAPYGNERDLDRLRFTDEFAQFERQLDEELAKARPAQAVADPTEN
ncbi:ABC transporter ATP-binding protein [Diaminobutyricimonas sp. TR449]|uniref:ABC transporter ATP-binding protein n=1 Tax=Diaminobutyricimonas sp. TR449 TaxID=2708076 RepID=UPI0014214215|nr:ABC transporter ATP-binding protein [Diaminobutyricimonas sp. TR449]